jgi:hypothetical protein
MALRREGAQCIAYACSAWRQSRCWSRALRRHALRRAARQGHCSSTLPEPTRRALAADHGRAAFAFCRQLIGVWKPGSAGITRLGPPEPVDLSAPVRPANDAHACDRTRPDRLGRGRGRHPGEQLPAARNTFPSTCAEARGEGGQLLPRRAESGEDGRRLRRPKLHRLQHAFELQRLRRSRLPGRNDDADTLQPDDLARAQTAVLGHLRRQARHLPAAGIGSRCRRPAVGRHRTRRRPRGERHTPGLGLQGSLRADVLGRHGKGSGRRADGEQPPSRARPRGTSCCSTS